MRKGSLGCCDKNISDDFTMGFMWESDCTLGPYTLPITKEISRTSYFLKCNIYIYGSVATLLLGHVWKSSSWKVFTDSF